MTRYHNLSGKSNVTQYQLYPDAIVVEFGDGSQYLYDASAPGPALVAQMVALAQAGQGLNSLISRVVRKNYARKIR